VRFHGGAPGKLDALVDGLIRGTLSPEVVVD